MEQELLKNNFERHGFKTSFFDTKKAASDYLKDQISGKKVAIGGSVTAQEMGLYEALSKKNEEEQLPFGSGTGKRQGARCLWKREVPRCT